ncbi:hypothetical protein [Sphingobacterium kitahiroshimense]|uniref:hypothetical protein n=1 Tax=Sphingobacterium kitahiroshimense TaxID=470446 RepID=UPI00320B299E
MKSSLKKLTFLLSFGAFVFGVNYVNANPPPADCSSSQCPGSGKLCCKDNDKNSTFYKQ